MATIEKRLREGGVSWRAEIRLKGYPRQRQTFRRRTDAVKWAQQTESEMRSGRFSGTREAQRRTVGELVDRYLEEQLDGKRAARDVERALRWWKATIGHLILAKVTPAVLGECKAKLQGEGIRGRQRAPATVNRYLAYFSHALTVAAREWQWIERNPARAVSRLKEPRGRVRFLDDAERERLLAACRESADPRLYPLVLLALATGARQGELLRLAWRDLDFARRSAALMDTKNGESRSVPVTGEALEVLRGLSGVRRIGVDRIFTGPDGRVTFPRKPWERALMVAGVEDFRWHDLRHSAASYLAMSGASAREIAEVLGHKTLTMVQRYSHLLDSHVAAVAQRMTDRFLPPAGRR